MVELVYQHLTGIRLKGCKDLGDRRFVHLLLGSTCLVFLLGRRTVSSVSPEMGSHLDEPASTFLPRNLQKPWVPIDCSQSILLQGCMSITSCRTGKREDQGAYTSVPAVLAARELRTYLSTASVADIESALGLTNNEILI